MVDNIYSQCYNSTYFNYIERIVKESYMSGSTTSDFFQNQKEKSKIKTYIVSEFFKAYYSILYNAKYIKKGFNYIDLFCGPGVYKDGSKSTPVVLLDIINNSNGDIAKKINMVFNDDNKEYYESLSSIIMSHPVYNKLSNKPIVYNKPAKNVDLNSILSNKNPTFSFIDPWGYKDISANQIKALVTSIGSDCILFFNVNRILQDLPKPTSEKHMRNIFGEEYTNALKIANNTVIKQNVKCKKFVELFSKNLYNQYFEKLKNRGYRLFVLPFSFGQDDTSKTSHYILFISKNHKAISEMKKIMVRKSNSFSSELSYDSKNELKISFFSRSDNIYRDVTNIIVEMLNNKKSLFSKKYTIIEWFEIFDRYSMKKDYIVTPYEFNEFKDVIDALDKQGYIDIHSDIKKKRITNKVIFSFKNSTMEI